MSIFSQLIIYCWLELDTSSRLRPMRQPNFKKSILWILGTDFSQDVSREKINLQVFPNLPNFCSCGGFIVYEDFQISANVFEE